jgi:hypothetical protein
MSIGDESFYPTERPPTSAELQLGCSPSNVFVCPGITVRQELAARFLTGVIIKDGKFGFDGSKLDIKRMVDISNEYADELIKSWDNPS